MHAVSVRGHAQSSTCQVTPVLTFGFGVVAPTSPFDVVGGSPSCWEAQRESREGTTRCICNTLPIPTHRVACTTTAN